MTDSKLPLEHNLPLEIDELIEELIEFIAHWHKTPGGGTGYYKTISVYKKAIKEEILGIIGEDETLYKEEKVLDWRKQREIGGNELRAKQRILANKLIKEAK